MDDDAKPYLHFKLDKYSDFWYNKMGFMDVEDIRSKILMSKFTEDETRAAIDYCVSIRYLNAYYQISCPECKQDSYYLEQDPSDNVTSQHILSDGISCKHCGHTHKPDTPYNKVYCIPQNVMYDGTDDEVETSIWSRFLSLIGIK